MEIAIVLMSCANKIPTIYFELLATYLFKFILIYLLENIDNNIGTLVIVNGYIFAVVCK